MLSGSTIDYTGITSEVLSNSVICSTNHLTDFVLEEHLDPYKSIVDPEIPVHVLETLKAYNSFAFWISLIMLLALPGLIIFAIKKDKNEQDKYSINELRYQFIHVYNCIYSNIKIKDH